MNILKNVKAWFDARIAASENEIDAELAKLEAEMDAAVAADELRAKTRLRDAL